jgi:geranylgeranyl diphosphate synthase type I
MITKLKKDIDLALRNCLKDSGMDKALKGSSPLLYKGIQDFLKRGGKRVRPLLFILSYLGYNNKNAVSPKKLIRSSLAFELLHDFLLIHDDVIDNSAMRRGKPTMHRFFNKAENVHPESDLGPNLSIVAGDIIFAMSIDALMSFDGCRRRKERALAVFTETTADTGIGEFIDVHNNLKKIEHVTEKEILLTYTMKTAQYTFGSPLVIGAILGGANKQEINKLSRLGTLMGHAFQLQDDLLDLFGSSKKTGKPVLSDLDEGKKTLPLWKAYRTLKEKDKKRLKTLLEKKKKTRKDLKAMRDLIETSGAREYCEKAVSSLLRKAARILPSLKMKKEFREYLRGFLQSVIVGT